MLRVKIGSDLRQASGCQRMRKTEKAESFSFTECRQIMHKDPGKRTSLGGHADKFRVSKTEDRKENS